jgi:hypothetical protein
VYQYEDENGVRGKRGWRPLNADDRESLLGFRPGHTLAALKREERPGGHYQRAGSDIRCSLLGNSFSCPAVAALLGNVLHSLGILPEAPGMAQIHGGLWPQELELLRDYEQYQGTLEISDEQEAVRQLHRQACFKGSDLRICDGSLYSPLAWPRQNVDSRRWHWAVVLAYARKGAHINQLELGAILAAQRWRTRTNQGIGIRRVHLTDSQVCQAVVTKGRSSSYLLMNELRRLNSLVMASSSWLVYGYVRSADNPADAPSRWGNE